ncbi:hypothetical protein [Chryseolinea soli]|nr:hypothetical protein [Chryseolinea soli]
MKLSTILLLISIWPGSLLCAQTKLTNEEFSRLICRKWTMTEMQLGSMKVPSSELGENTTAFEANGTYKAVEQGEAYSGKWTFDPATQTLTTNDRDGIEKSKVIKLTEKELVFEMTDSDGIWRMTLKSP